MRSIAGLEGANSLLQFTYEVPGQQTHSSCHPYLNTGHVAPNLGFGDTQKWSVVQGDRSANHGQEAGVEMHQSGHSQTVAAGAYKDGT